MKGEEEVVNGMAPEPQAMQEIPLVRELRRELEELQDQARAERRAALFALYQMTVDDVLAGQSEEDAPAEGDGLTPDERLDRGLAEGETGEVVQEAPVCDYPGCARDPGHRGLHRDADGKRVSDVDIEPKGDGS